MRPHRRQPTRLPHPWNSPGKNTGVGCHFLLQCRTVKSESEVTQSCPTPSDPMDCSPPDPSVHGTSQAGIPEGLAMSSSKDVPNTWIEHRSPALQEPPTEPPGKPLTTLPSIGEGNGNPLQCSCLENPMDKGARQATTINNN